jgi:hypothetical protein
MFVILIGTQAPAFNKGINEAAVTVEKLPEQ